MFLFIHVPLQTPINDCGSSGACAHAAEATTANAATVAMNSNAEWPIV